MGQKQIKVSDHAIVRYMERILGVNIGNIRKAILTDTVRIYVDTLGPSGTYPASEKHRVRIENGIIVTVLGPNENS